MTKIRCEVVEDLMPLYIEELLSQESKELVEEHIKTCEACFEMAKVNRQPMPSMPLENDATLYKIQKNLYKNKAQSVAIAVLLTCIVMVVGFGYLTARVYHPYSEEIVQFKLLGNQIMVAEFSESVMGFDINERVETYGEGTIYHLTTWTHQWPKTNKNSSTVIINPNGETVKAIYYYHPNSNLDQLIYGEDPSTGGVATLPRLFLAYYLTIAIGLLFFFLVLALIFRRHSKWYPRIRQLAQLPLSYIVAHFVMMGNKSSSYSATRDFLGIAFLTILIATTMALITQKFGKIRRM